ncbi:MAG: altronate dehydratase family protein [Candidatus Methanomethylicaceae archaeon]
MDNPKGRIIRLSQKDNVAMALTEIPPDIEIEEGFFSRERIPKGHKIAVKSILPGDPIQKYGQIIGFASKAIQIGEHVHTHNVEVRRFDRKYDIGVDVRETVYVPEEERDTFMGFLRRDGRVATRNYLGILATSNCAAGVVRCIADRFKNGIFQSYPNIDGIVALAPSSGCGMAEASLGLAILQKILRGYITHPNFAAILLVGLGCETNHIDCFLENMGIETSSLLNTLSIQHAGGTENTIRQGVEKIWAMLAFANEVKRQPISVSHLICGLECGGSDAFSGLSANPALGRAVDLLVLQGGTAILTETPEIYGAEHLLVRRAVSKEVGLKIIEAIRWWEDYTARNGAEINNNPTPGNKAGGITTIYEKSLAAITKGGTTNLVDIFQYGDPVPGRGLIFMDGPAYDPVSTTGLIAAGAHLICFTTGRGTICGSTPSPTIKLVSTTEVYRRMESDMDINCGVIIDGELSVEEMGKRIYHEILEVASGKKTKSELHGFGEESFQPWNIGAIL